MSTLSPSTAGPSGTVKLPDASPFRSLPASVFGWVAAGAALFHLVLVTVMARTVFGLPTWLDFTLGLVPGAVATVLVVLAMTRWREHSWVLWLAAISLLWSFGGWLVFTWMAFL